jgi:hypothetical protein
MTRNIKRVLRLLVATLAPVVVLSGSAVAQDRQETPPEGVVRVFADPTLRSPLRVPVSQVILSGTSEKSLAKAEIGLQGVSWGFRVSGQTPLDDKATEAVLLDLDGLRTATTVGIGLTWLNWRPKINDLSAAQAICNKAKVPVCAKDALPEYLQDDYDLAVDYGLRVTGAVEARVGREVFEFSDPTTLDEDEEERTPVSVAASAGVYVPSGILNGLWSASLEGQRSYRAGQKTEICRPTAVASVIRCADETIGAPTESERVILTGGHRRRFGSAVAIAPRIHYDLQNSELGVELPIYALRNADRGLTGGITLGWTTESEELAVQIFVGSIFGIFGK